MASATAVAQKENAVGFENAKFRLETIPMAKIHFSEYSLRDADRNDEEYQRLRDAIAASDGPLMPILVREIDDPDNKGEKAFGLIDGRQRYSCCLDLGFKNIPARVIDMNDAKIASAQIIANRSRIETKPIEYTKQLHRMLSADPTLTLEELSEQLHASVQWLRTRLSLANLHEKIGPLVDEGKITLANAFALVKLKPPEEQLAFVQQAQTMGVQEFSGHVTNRVKELQKAARAGRDPNATRTEFVPVPHMRPVKEIKAELESTDVANVVCAKLNAETPEDGFRAAILWVLSLDPDKVEVLRQQDVDRKKAAAAEKVKKDAEKAKKKAEDARLAAEKAGITLEQHQAANPDTDDDEDDDN